MSIVFETDQVSKKRAVPTLHNPFFVENTEGPKFENQQIIF